MQMHFAIFSHTQIGEAVLPWRKLAQASDKQTSRHTDTDIHDKPNGGQIRQDNFLYVAARSAAHRRRRWGPLGPPAPGDPSLHLTAGTRMFYALDSRNTDVLCTARANQGRRKQPAGLRNDIPSGPWEPFGTLRAVPRGAPTA